MKTRWQPWRWHLGVIALYTLLALALTFPTITHPATHLPGDGGDDPALAWNLWWVKTALLDLQQNPFVSDHLFYPLGINLAFYTLTPLNAFLAMPFLLNGGVVLASNLHTWLTFVLNGYGAFLLVSYLLGHGSSGELRGGLHRAAFLAGLSVAFASSKLFYVALGQFNIASSHWIPFALLFIIRAEREPFKRRWVLLAALALILQAWAELTFASFLLLFIALYYGWRLAADALAAWRRAPRPPLWPCWRRHAANLLFLGALVSLGISPFLVMMLSDLVREGDFMVEGSGFAEAFSADLAGFLIPTVRHPSLGWLVTLSGVTHYSVGQHIYLGYAVLGLAALGLAGRGAARLSYFWPVAATLYLLLCLGPTVTVYGQETGIPGPFALLQELPFFKGNRYPSRFSVMLLATLAPLVGVGAWRLERLLRARAALATAVTALLAFLFTLEHLAIPLPQSDMRVPEAYHVVAREAGDFALLDIPLAWRNGFRITGPHHPAFMFGQFYQTEHGKRLLGGNTSRNPAFKFQYFTEAPVINSLLALQTGYGLPPGRLAEDRALAAQVLCFFNVRYIAVRPVASADPKVTPGAVMPYIEALFPVAKVVDEPQFKLYRVELPPLSERLEIRPGQAMARLYFGEGWGRQPASDEGAVWAQRREARLLVPLNGEAQWLSARVRAPGGAEGRKLWLGLNGWRSEAFTLSEAWQEIRLEIPAGVAHPGLNDIRLHFDGLSGPPEGDRVEITVVSAGLEVGNLGQIFVNGRDVSPGLPGYNVAIIDPLSGQVEAANFNTFRDPAASAALAAFLEKAPEGMIVAVAAADTVDLPPEFGGPLLTEAAVAALAAVGSEADLRGSFRISHAFIGGRRAAEVWEAVDQLRPVAVTNGGGLTEPHMAAQFAWLRFEAAPR